jgi:hypothetical protein
MAFGEHLRGGVRERLHILRVGASSQWRPDVDAL